MDRAGWWATIHGVQKNWTQLSTHTHTRKCMGKNESLTFEPMLSYLIQAYD